MAPMAAEVVAKVTDLYGDRFGVNLLISSGSLSLYVITLIGWSVIFL